MESTDFNPVVTMKRPAILAIIVFFLLSTAAVAPFAFRLGLAHGAASLAEMSQNDTLSVAYMKRIGAQEGCPLLGTNATLNNRGFIVDCLPSGKGHSVRIASKAKPRRQVRTIFDAPIKRQPTALDQAVMASLTAQGNRTPSSPGDPLSLAMVPFQEAPSASIFQNPGNFGGGGAGFLPGGGLPNNLIPPRGVQAAGPGLEPSNSPTGNGGDPEPPIFVIPDGEIDPTVDPDLVTPIPGALPLMITGLAGLFASRRRKTTK